MAVMKWTPWADLDAMERRMRRFFDEVGIVPAPMPAADIYETDGEFVVELEVPGYEEKDLAIELADHTLVVKGELETEKDEKEKSFRLHERLEKRFEFGQSQAFSLIGVPKRRPGRYMNRLTPCWPNTARICL